MRKRCIETLIDNDERHVYDRPHVRHACSARFLKSHLTVNDYYVSATAGAAAAAAAGPPIDARLLPLLREYQRTCRLRKDWIILRDCVVQSSVVADVEAFCDAAQLCRPPLPLIAGADDARSSAVAPSPPLHDQRQQQRQQQHGSGTKSRRRVLVPMSGGLSSLACLWWALQNDYHVYLCYVNGVRGANARAEFRALMELLRYGRDQDGEPFVQYPQNAAGEALLSPYSRVKIVPIAEQPYVPPAHAAQLSPGYEGPVHENPFVAEASFDEACGLKWHPLTYVLLYRTLLNVAQAFECDTIIFGAYDAPRSMLAAAHQSFSAIVLPHRIVFPFERRIDAVYALQEASERSQQMWQSIAAAAAAAGAEVNDEASGGGAASEAAATVAPPPAGLPGAESYAVVHTTPGPSLMPDVAHFAWTCRARRWGADDDAKPEEPPKKPVAKKRKTGDVTAADEDDTTLSTAEFLRAFYQARHWRGVNIFQWCGNCVDCLMWRSVSWLFHRRIGSSPHCLPLRNEYIALLTEGFWSYTAARGGVETTDDTKEKASSERRLRAAFQVAPVLPAVSASAANTNVVQEDEVDKDSDLDDSGVFDNDENNVDEPDSDHVDDDDNDDDEEQDNEFISAMAPEAEDEGDVATDDDDDEEDDETDADEEDDEDDDDSVHVDDEDEEDDDLSGSFGGDGGDDDADSGEIDYE